MKLFCTFDLSWIISKPVITNCLFSWCCVKALVSATDALNFATVMVGKKSHRFYYKGEPERELKQPSSPVQTSNNENKKMADQADVYREKKT